MARTCSRNFGWLTMSTSALPTAIASGLPPNVEPWVPAGMPLAPPGSPQARTQGEAPADALGRGHDVGLHPGPLVGKQLAGAADAGLNLVEDEQQAMLVAKRAEVAQ